ncbi:hypothetical protein BJ508DRAFT_416324 [Ascobolus immersus RN42]|uniref:Uncharacterized protein n=1 Tax=Ascobolus immersus RN42 TaxID=1160509 RepID=A0A3N4HYT4_ASCIM|nr:hypothetical protein BJ508DRAFT_416324 [Ascobolus immersus RN42]
MMADALSRVIWPLVQCAHQSADSSSSEDETRCGILRSSFNAIVWKREQYLAMPDVEDRRQRLLTLVEDLQECFGDIGYYEGMDWYLIEDLVNRLIDIMVEAESPRMDSEIVAPFAEPRTPPRSPLRSDQPSNGQIEEITRLGQQTSAFVEPASQTESCLRAAVRHASKASVLAEADLEEADSISEFTKATIKRALQRPTQAFYSPIAPLRSIIDQAVDNATEGNHLTAFLDGGVSLHPDGTDDCGGVALIETAATVHQDDDRVPEPQEDLPPSLVEDDPSVIEDNPSVISEKVCASSTISDSSAESQQGGNSNTLFRSSPPVIGSLFNMEEEPALPTLPKSSESLPHSSFSDAAALDHESARISSRKRPSEPDFEVGPASKRGRVWYPGVDEETLKVEAELLSETDTSRVWKGNLLIFPKNGPIPKETASYEETRALVFRGWRFGMFAGPADIPTWPNKQIKEADYYKALTELYRKTPSSGFTSGSVEPERVSLLDPNSVQGQPEQIAAVISDVFSNTGEESEEEEPFPSTDPAEKRGHRSRRHLRLSNEEDDSGIHLAEEASSDYSIDFEMDLAPFAVHCLRSESPPPVHNGEENPPLSAQSNTEEVVEWRSLDMSPQPTPRDPGVGGSSHGSAATDEGSEEVMPGMHGEKGQWLSLLTKDARRVIESQFNGRVPEHMEVGEFFRLLAHGAAALEPPRTGKPLVGNAGAYGNPTHLYW